MGTETAADEQHQHASEKTEKGWRSGDRAEGESCNPSAIKGVAGQQGKQVPAVSYTMAQGLCLLGPHEVRGGG